MNYKSKLNDHVNLKITYCNNNKERIKRKYIQIHRSRINQQLNPINHLSKKKKFTNQNHRQTNFLNRLSQLLISKRSLERYHFFPTRIASQRTENGEATD